MLSLLSLSASALAPPISVLGCTEALCGGCADFVTGGLATAFEAEGVADIMNITMVPFGNARYVKGKLDCQHGPEECLANSYEQCAIDAYPDFKMHLPFYICMEKAGSKMVQNAKKCADSTSLDYDKIKACVDNPGQASALQEKFFHLTPSDHKYTPWVVVDGKLSKSNGDKLLEEVCAAYTGDKPAGCSAVLRKEKRLCMNEAVVEA